MSFWENIKNWFQKESTAAREWSADLKRDLSSDLDRKEADLRATPIERLENLQEQISGNTDAFDDIRGKIAAAGIDPDADDARADDARADDAGADDARAGDGGADDAG